MGLKVVRVQFYQAGHDQVAGRIFAPFGCATLAKFRNAAIRNGNPAVLDHAIGENYPGVAKQDVVPCRGHHLKRLSLCRGCKRGHIDDSVGDQTSYLIVMDNGDHGHARPFLLTDQFDHDGPIGSIE
jgi:hypothetical protein